MKGTGMKDTEIIRRYTALKSDRTDVEEVWSLLERFVMPYRGKFYIGKEYDGKPDWRRREIYDATACDAASALVASILGNLVSPSTRWFDLRFRRSDLNREDSPKEWLDAACEESFYALQSSNFNLKISETFMDIVGFGTGCLVEEWDDDRLVFSSVPIRECYFEIGHKEQVLRFYRKLEWDALQIVDKFGEDNVPQVVKDALEKTPEASNKFEVVYCVFKRDNVPDNVDWRSPADPKMLPYGYKYILCKEQKQLGDEGGYYDMPVFLVRWRTVAGSIWGHGPGLPVLSTIMTLNQAVAATLESAEKMIEPPLMTTQSGVIGDIDMKRGGVTTVGDINDLQPLPVGGDINVATLITEEMRGQIRRAFFEDQLELKESPQMTATEVQVRYELMQRLLGPTLGRLISDLLDPLIERTLRILIRNRKIDMPEFGFERGESNEIDVEYVGPLPRAQKSDQAATMLGWAGQISQMAEIKPEVLDIPDWDVLFSEVGNLSGVPAAAINSKSQIKKIRDERKRQIERQRELMQAEQAGAALKNFGQAGQEIAAMPPEAIAAMQQSIPPREAR